MILTLVFSICILALAVASYFFYYVMKQDKGTKEMQKISDAIREGAVAFMKRQYKTIGILTLLVAALLFIVYFFTGQTEYAWKTALAFIIGAVSSGLAGIIGMYVSVRANLRTAAAAKKSLGQALFVAIRGGAVSGIIVVALSLFGVAGLYYAFGANPQETPFLIVGYAFGASFVALFAQLGGGIFTKAADIGADLVGKVEKGIAEDDPRNPAVIADLVGDNVGDCAGRGADLFESTAAENIGAMILGVALFPVFGLNGVLFPLVVRALGLLASMIGIFAVRSKENSDPMKVLNRGYFVASFLAAVGFYFATMQILNNVYFFYAGLVGIVVSILFVYITQYYTESKYRPVKEIAEASETGAATNIISGLAVGLESTALPVIVISSALFISYKFGVWSAVPNGGLYGTAIATMGMLSTAAYILAMDTFGPITDNAGGIAKMSNSSQDVCLVTDKLDAVGNTTKALTKGYAIGSAALASFLLFSAYMDVAQKLMGAPFRGVDISKVHVFIGALLGAMLIFLFSAFAIRAVGKTASEIIAEVRKQLKSKGVMNGTVKPDYAKCVDITTKGALKNMILPSTLVVLFPIVVGVLLKAEAVAAFLMVGTITGVLMALFFNNSGGALDNAKKLIETNGKGSEAYKAAVVGDTVSDCMKDTAGPSLHVVIKLLATLTLVLAPLFI